MSKSPKDTKGPIVKTGPTQGKNRSRNKDGQWRSKRSDAGKSRSSSSKSGGKKGCFLTTAACEFHGLPDDCHELQTLRRLRDEVLVKTSEGAAMVEEYYQIAPRLVPLLHDPKISQQVWQGVQTAVRQINARDPEAAISTYRRMVADLLRQEQDIAGNIV